MHDRVRENFNNISAIWKTLKIQVKLILNRQKAIITNYTNYSDYTNWPKAIILIFQIKLFAQESAMSVLAIIAWCLPTENYL